MKGPSWDRSGCERTWFQRWQSTSTVWEKCSWLCPPISTTPSARQRRLQWPSQDKTCCETSSIHRQLNTSTGWTKRWSWLCLPISTIPSARQQTMTEPLQRCEWWTSTEWTKSRSWLCPPISTTSIAKQWKMQGTLRDSTCCETSRIQRRLNSIMGWTKRWSWRRKRDDPYCERLTFTILLNVSYTRIQELRSFFFRDRVSDHLSANRYWSHHLHYVQDLNSLTDSFYWGYDLTIRVRRARLTSCGDLIHCHCHCHPTTTTYSKQPRHIGTKWKTTTTWHILKIQKNLNGQTQRKRPWTKGTTEKKQ